MDIKHFEEIGNLHVKVSKEDFNKSILAKCLYWYTSDFIVNVEDQGDKFDICFIPKEKELEIGDLYPKINQDLIDFKLRSIIDEETRTIRELIIAKAFSHGEYDEDPPGELDDPIGVNFFE